MKPLFTQKITALTLAVIYIMASSISTFAQTDLFIETDPVSQVYSGHADASSIIENLQFDDLSSDHWAHEAVSRLGALEVIKGYNNGNFGPSDLVSKEMVLTMIVRAVGMEADAIEAADAIAADDPTGSILDIWSRGYMQIANELGLIDAGELADALNLDQTTLDPDADFVRASSVTREQVAVWLIDGINEVTPGLLAPDYTLNSVYNYTDVDDITPNLGPYIEEIINQNIMVGSNNRFNPQGELTRAELAQVMKNLDTIMFDSMNYSRYNGTIGRVIDSSVTENGMTEDKRTILVRNSEGLVDQFDYSKVTDAISQVTILDAPVLRNGQVVGLQALTEGEEVEYIVDDATGDLLYVYAKGVSEEAMITGQLQPMTGLDENQITIKVDDENISYTMAGGVYDGGNDRIVMNEIWYDVADAPVGGTVRLHMLDNVVTEIEVIAEPALYGELSGIVKEINTTFKYINIITWDGEEVTTNYVESGLIVEKQMYYDEYDEIGYIDEMFPDYRFDERDNTIDAVEVGDIVHMRLDTQNDGYITMISAKTNYIVKFGEVKEISHFGAEGSSLMVELEDLSTAVYHIEHSVPIKKLGKNVSMAELQPGDTVRMLINQAVINPGTISESVKELVIDAYGYQVEGVYRGSMGTFNQVQNELTLLDAYELGLTGWRDYNDAMKIEMSYEVDYFYNGDQTTLNYILNSLVSDDLEVYVATEDYYGKEVARMVSIRSGRDTIIDYTNVTYANGFDTMNLLSVANDIGMDPGTIVVKNDRLVEVGNIMSPDYAQVALNDGYKAAVINIEPEPSNDGIDVFRGRLASIEDGQSFTVHSHAALLDIEWIYSPIERIFNIDHNTVIIEEDGPVDIDDFISYSDITKVDNVYTIIADGDYASHVIENPYAKEAITGEIYDITADQLSVKDVMVYSSDDGLWDELSYANSYAFVDLLENSIILKNNEVIPYYQLEEGDRIKVLTTDDLQELLLLDDERAITGYIILVER